MRILKMFLLSLLTAGACAADELTKKMKDYNVVWSSLSKDERAAMPMGNGRTGVNVWVEEDGDILFYLSMNDSFSEATRLLKLGRVRIHLDPNPFVKNAPFKQELDILNGVINISGGTPDNQVELSLFCDQNSDAIYVRGQSKSKIQVTVSVENWRKSDRELTKNEKDGTRTLKGAPKRIKVWESGDTFTDDNVGLLWYHHNKWSAVAEHIDAQGLEVFKDIIPDPIDNLTSGARISSDEFEAVNKTTLGSKGKVSDFELRIVTASQQMEEPQQQFPKLMDRICSRLDNSEVCKSKTALWWNNYWEKSYVLVDEKGKVDMPKGYSLDKAPPSRITQAYMLARFLATCQNRSQYPLHFQGGIFIPGNDYMAIPRRPKLDRSTITPDYCFHGSHYWWQNVRLPYHPLLAQGSTEEFRKFLDFYLSLQPVFEAISKTDYKADGLFMRETMTMFGLPAGTMFGWGKKQYSNNYTKDMWQQSLELSCMMLDYVDYTEDQDYLKSKVIPFCLQSLRFFDSRFKTDANGRILISPSHAVETYWFEVENDMPTVAGLHALTKRLIALENDSLSTSNRNYVRAFSKRIPELPLKTDNGVTMLDHAERYKNKRTNYEAPSLYAVFPFGNYGLGRDNIEYAKESYKRMRNPMHHCWAQTGIFAARLGLAQEAAKDISHRASLFVPGFRFPGFFNSPFDSPPDMDGPGAMQVALQEMLLQADPYSDKLYLLPSWPKEWDVDFKLHAPKKTTIEASVRNGKVINLKVVPESRKKDIVITYASVR